MQREISPNQKLHHHQIDEMIMIVIGMIVEVRGVVIVDIVGVQRIIEVILGGTEGVVGEEDFDIRGCGFILFVSGLDYVA